ncbi:MAG: D-alanyl-D-alanine carboxypeptidase family protein [Bdellovibrionales bacterium]|nr:D-alanyl-D-alanine carboxypeptidase family protein [Bdellovibrionales bacterium]
MASDEACCSKRSNTALAVLWLTENASRFEFQLSYPRNNDHGIIYEPWHWYCTAR